ncbi:MAG: acyl carrier protein [Clostridia bacterium]|nr:acyl carrier protein [Clostridia bacterium]
MSNIRNEILQILSGVIDDGADISSYESVAIKDLNMDSLQMYEVIIELEEKYDIKLSDDIIDTIETVDDLIKLVESLCNDN